MNSRKLYILPLTIILGIVMTLFAGCKDEKKNLIIPQDKMVDVLYDYHIIQAVSNSQVLDSFTRQKYMAAMYTKHGITQEMMDTSFVYYLRHMTQMQEIYSQLADKINNESRLQGAGNNIAVYKGTSLNGDTANIWTKEQGIVLSATVPNNLLTFKFDADTTYHAGDKFLLMFKTEYIYQKGQPNGLATISLKLKNDSVITRTMTLASPNDIRMEITDDKREGIKQISGFILNRGQLSENPTTDVRLLVGRNIQLLKIHTPDPNKKEEKDEEKPTDSIAPAVKPSVREQ